MQKVLKKSFDYIVVGAGSSGATIAGRLAQKTNKKIGLIEIGPPDDSELIHVPVNVAFLIGRNLSSAKKYTWNLTSEKEPYCNNRQIFTPRGKTLGGTSSINGTIYIRGIPQDYDTWASLGNKGWSYKDVLPYFIRAENNQRIKNEFHGNEGPLIVSDHNWFADSYKLLFDNFQALGIPTNNDFNGKDQYGVGEFQVTINKGRRWNTSRAYLDPVKSNKNLEIFTEHRINKVELEGKKAIGVSVTNLKDQKNYFFEAGQEVILCGGAFQSPQLLLLSGIGDKKQLNQHQIEIKHELPGVGQNLQDHQDLPLMVTFKDIPIDYCLSFANIGKQIKGFMQYRKDRTGFMGSNICDHGAFIKINENSEFADVHNIGGLFKDHARQLVFGDGVAIHTCLLRPESRGEVTLKSRDPSENPKILYNYLQSGKDVDLLEKSVRWSHRYLRTPEMRQHIQKYLDLDYDQLTDSQVKEFTKQRVDTIYHPTGTCKMGQDQMSVVNAELKVHGIEGLRVADASIMPNVISGNTNAPCIMIGEKAADMIINDINLK